MCGLDISKLKYFWVALHCLWSKHYIWFSTRKCHNSLATNWQITRGVRLRNWNWQMERSKTKKKMNEEKQQRIEFHVVKSGKIQFLKRNNNRFSRVIFDTSLPRCLKIIENVSFYNIASEASYVYILKLVVKQCYQTGQK